MDPRLSSVTLPVADLDAARRVYLDGPGRTSRRSDGQVGTRTAAARAWGGHAGQLADPDGFRWEVAHNPGPTGEMVLP